MAEKVRCISNAILYNDNFITLPSASKILYVYINNETDDAGFCDHVATVLRTLGLRRADLKALVDKGYLIPITDWLYLEKHFWINNRGLRRDRLKASRYAEYLEGYEIKPNGAYTLATKCQPNDDKTAQNGSLIEGNRSEGNRSELNRSDWKERQEKEKEAIMRAFDNQLRALQSTTRRAKEAET